MIRDLLTPFLLLITLAVSPGLEAQFSEDFEDGDFTMDPVWNGDAGLFTVVEENGDQLLRSNSPGAATYHLSTPSTLAANAQWEFFLELRFGTSGVNYVDAYLMSQQADLNTSPDGYFVRIGDTPDQIVLYKRQGGVNTMLVQSPGGTVGSSSSNPFRIRVTRDPDDLWTLSYHPGTSGIFIAAGSATDNAFSACTHFGLKIVQSSAASAINNHFFDDLIVGAIPVDDVPPTIASVTVLDELHLDLKFDEPVEQGTAEDENNYDLQPFNSISSALRDASDLSLVHLTLGLPLLNGNSYTLNVNGVTDLASNATDNAMTDFLYFIPDVPEIRDVVINEFMADPAPVVGLPDAEYVELYNATPDKYFDLAGWRFRTSSSTVTLPNYTLGPGQYVVLVANSNVPLFTGISGMLGLSSLPGLVNDGTTLTLEWTDNMVLDQLSYDLGWYRDPNKEDGGWSLEQIDPSTPCSDALNWRASTAMQGGTPGTVNAVLDLSPDTTPPSLLQVLPVSDTVIELVFNEGMDATSLSSGSYEIDPPIAIQQIIPLPPVNQRVQLMLDGTLSEGVIYTITVTEVSDCPGNPIGDSNSVLFALPEEQSPGDVVINEVLHNPITTGGEYVEVYNRSEKVLSLQGWKMANVSNGVIANPEVITNEPLLLFPGTYLLFTRSTTVTANQYPLGHTDRFLTVDLPSYTNADGTVVLQDAGNIVIDLFSYNEDMHFPLLQSVKGVSLERQDPVRSTDDRTNWHSAAEYVGFGTPGYENSQFAPAPVATGEMNVDPGIFSPDNDGYQDVLTITYRFDQPEFVGTMRVFDISGREVQRLMDNELLGTYGAISWDGVLDDGSLGRIGAYIIGFEVYDLSGNVQNLKKTVTLAHRLD